MHHNMNAKSDDLRLNIYHILTHIIILIQSPTMNETSQQKQSQKQQLLMTEKRKYPEVFRWKIAVIVIVVLTAIILVVDLIMVLYLKNHQLRNNNYTFAADLVNLLAGTNITRSQFVNLIGGLTSSYTDIWFQKAVKVAAWTALSQTMLDLQATAKMFETKVTNRVTLVRFTDGVSTSILGAFTHIPFQLPDTWNTFLDNETNSYFNFEIDDKQSTLFGSNSQDYLKMDGTADNLANCRIIKLDKLRLSLLLGSTILLNSDNQPKIYLSDSAQIPSTCFSSDSFDDTLSSMVGPFQFNQLYDIVDINTYQLRT